MISRFGLFLLNRVADGLDGAVARASMTTDFGGYLDIVCDFVFYSAIPFAFAVALPENAFASAFLIFSFIGTASSFLAFAILAEKHNISTEIRGKKAFYYLGGLTEGVKPSFCFLQWSSGLAISSSWLLDLDFYAGSQQ